LPDSRSRPWHAVGRLSYGAEVSASECHFFYAPFPCPTRSNEGKRCNAEMAVFGDHAACCHHGPSLLFRHNNVRDILGHAARGAGLAAVVIEKKNQIAGSTKKPGDISVQQYHRGFATSAFDVTVSHPLQKKYLTVAMEEAGVVAQEAHDRKLQKSLALCRGGSIARSGPPQENVLVGPVTPH